MKCGNSTLPMSPVATEIEIAGGGACPTTSGTSVCTGNYTTTADANLIACRVAGPMIPRIIGCGSTLVRRSGQKISTQQVGSNAKVMLAIGGDLVAAGANRLGAHPFPRNGLRACAIPLIFISRPTRRSPTSRPSSLRSMVIRGLP